MTYTPDITNRQFLAGLLLILVLAVALRGAFPTADPPWRAPVGITWHDGGPWVHNARNKGVLDANRGWKVIHAFDVAETPGGHDRAALIEKP